MFETPLFLHYGKTKQEYLQSRILQNFAWLKFLVHLLSNRIQCQTNKQTKLNQKRQENHLNRIPNKIPTGIRQKKDTLWELNWTRTWYYSFQQYSDGYFTLIGSCILGITDFDWWYTTSMPFSSQHGAPLGVFRFLIKITMICEAHMSLAPIVVKHEDKHILKVPRHTRMLVYLFISCLYIVYTL